MPPGPRNPATNFLLAVRTPSSSSFAPSSWAPPVTARPPALPNPSNTPARPERPPIDQGGVDKPLDRSPPPVIIARPRTHARAR